MAKIKEVIKDESDLEQAIDKLLPEVEQVIAETIGHLQAEYKRALGKPLFRTIVNVILFILLVLAFTISETPLPPEVKTTATYSLFGVILVLVTFTPHLRLSRKKAKIITEYHAQFMKVLTPYLGKLFGVSAHHISQQNNVGLIDVDKNTNSDEKAKIIRLLQQSELVTERKTEYKVGDVIEIIFNETRLYLARVIIEFQQSGKAKAPTPEFTGYFITCELPQTLQGKTFITAEGDEYGFGNRSITNHLRDIGAQETILEWNEFEKVLHVSSTNPTEARYILNPAFMQDLHAWWLGDTVRSRISFVHNTMNIFIALSEPGSKDWNAFYHKLKSEKWNDLTDAGMIKSHLSLLGKPLMRALHLLEDLK